MGRDLWGAYRPWRFATHARDAAGKVAIIPCAPALLRGESLPPRPFGTIRKSAESQHPFLFFECRSKPRLLWPCVGSVLWISVGSGSRRLVSFEKFALLVCPPMHPLTEAASSLEIHAGVAGECDDQGGGMRPGSLPHWRNFATLTGISESAVLDGHEMPLTRCPMPSPKNLRFRCHSWRTQEHFLHLVPRCCDATCTAWDIRPLNWRIAPHLGVFGDGFGVDHIHSSFYLIVRMYVW